MMLNKSIFKKLCDKYLLLLIFILLLVYRMFISTDLRVANDFPNVSMESVKNGLSLPYAWRTDTANGFGEYSVSTLWSYPSLMLHGLLAALGLPFWLIERLMGVVLALIVGVVASRKLTRFFGLGKWGGFCIAVVYLINSYIILLLDGGQFSVAVAYTFLPFAFVSIVEKLDSKSSEKILAGVYFAVMGFIDIRFGYLLILLLGMYAIFDVLFTRKRTHLWNWVLLFAVCASVFVVFHAYWIIPLILSSSGYVPSGYEVTSSTGGYSFTSLKHAVLFQQPHWYINSFGITTIHKEFITFPLLAIMGFIFSSKSKNNLFLGFLAVISIFLIKGTAQPLGFVNESIIKNIPGMFMFRDTTKFFVFLSISYSVFIGLFADWFAAKSGKRLGYKLFAIIIPLVVVAIHYPTYTNRLTGTFAKAEELRDYDSIYSTVGKDKGNYRILWVPSRNAYGTTFADRPLLEGLRLLSLTPFASGVVGTYETMNLLRDTDYIYQLLDISSVKYMAYPYPDENKKVLSNDEKIYYSYFSNQLAKKNELVPIHVGKPLSIYEFAKHSERLFLTSTYNILGSVRIYKELEEQNMLDLSKYSFIFNESDQESRFSKLDNEFPIILYRKADLDLAMSLIKTLKMHNLEASEVVGDGNWWISKSGDTIKWRAWLQEKYSVDDVDYTYAQNRLVMEDNTKIKIPKIEDAGLLFARVMTSGFGGEIKFLQGENTIGSINAYNDNVQGITLKLTGNEVVRDRKMAYEDANYKWILVGDYKPSDSLEIVSSAKLNVISNLTVVSDKDLADAYKLVSEMRSMGRVIDWVPERPDTIDSIVNNDNVGIVKFRKLNPTKFEVIVSGIEKPQTLVFNDLYDNRWLLNGEKAYEVYDLFNGFSISRDGTYLLTFSPQKYLNYGLWVSISSFFIIISLLALQKARK